MRIIKRLSNAMLSPIVIAICTSLWKDRDTWELRNYTGQVGCDNIFHKSGRFYIAISTDHCQIYNQWHVAASDLNALERFLIRCSAKSWMTAYNQSKVKKWNVKVVPAKALLSGEEA